MGFSLKRTLGLDVVSPNLPAVPNPTYYDDVPDFTPEEIAYLRNRDQLLKQYEAKLNAAPSAYDQTNDQIASAEQARYLAALNQQQGQLSVAQQQARKAEFQRLVEAAGRRGIRILGDDPSTASSNSTAGNQLLSEFNKRYDALADQQRVADLSFGYNANTGRLGLINQARQNYFSNNLALGDAYSGIQGDYQAQRAARYARSTANTDINNQFKLAQYDRDYNQSILNSQAKNQAYANRLGLFNSALQAGATYATGRKSGGGGGSMRRPQSDGYASAGYSA